MNYNSITVSFSCDYDLTIKMLYMNIFYIDYDHIKDQLDLRSSLITSYSLKHCLGNKVMIFNFPKSLHDILLPEESLSTLNLLVVVVGFRCSVVSNSL